VVEVAHTTQAAKGLNINSALQQQQKKQHTADVSIVRAGCSVATGQH
jgi:hypothetical protein